MRKSLIEKEYVANILSAPRRSDTDKRDYGDLLIFAGKEGMAGAAILAAKAALRSGAGLVKVATHKSNFPILQRALPEAICIEEDAALSTLAYYTAIVIGPGMGADERTEGIVKAVLDCAPINTPILIDADGLNAVAKNDELKLLICSRGERDNENSFGNIVITPHVREAARLIGCESIETPGREATCVELSEKFNCIALLKGSGTLIKTPLTDMIYQNTTGNPGMATAGSGDVLSGVIGSILAQGTDMLDSTIAGAFIHGLAGDIAAEKIGERSLIASDIVDALPEAFGSLSK